MKKRVNECSDFWKVKTPMKYDYYKERMDDIRELIKARLKSLGVAMHPQMERAFCSRTAEMIHYTYGYNIVADSSPLHCESQSSALPSIPYSSILETLCDKIAIRVYVGLYRLARTNEGDTADYWVEYNGELANDDCDIVSGTIDN